MRNSGETMSTENATVLIVEDDLTLRRTLHTTLAALGFEIGEAGTGEEAMRRLRKVDYEVVLLDMNMPGLDGIEVCRQIRRSSTRLQILMLTVRDGEDDKILALESGADDYITKPFQIGELTARIRSAVRRFRAHVAPVEGPLAVGRITLDPSRRTVEKAGERITVTPREFQALQFLMENAGKLITYGVLSTFLWGPDNIEHRDRLRMLIGSLRDKLEDDATNPEYVLTEKFYGYRFRDK
jgi:two-component system, OmpR family, KDP operon response regulator KdpE